MPFLPFVAGALIGGALVYVLKKDKKRKD